MKCWPDEYTSVFPHLTSVKYPKYRKTFLILDILGVLIALSLIVTAWTILINEQQTEKITTTSVVINRGTIKSVVIECTNAKKMTVITDYQDEKCRNVLPFNNITIFENEKAIVPICGSSLSNDGPIVIYGTPTGTALVNQTLLAKISFENGKTRYLPALRSRVVDNIVISETRIIDQTHDDTRIEKITKMTQVYDPAVTTGMSCEMMGNNPFVFTINDCGWKRLMLDNSDIEVVTTMKTSLTTLLSSMLSALIIWSVVGMIIVIGRRLFLCAIPSSTDEKEHHIGDIEIGHISQGSPTPLSEVNEISISTSQHINQDFREGGSTVGSLIVIMGESTVNSGLNAINNDNESKNKKIIRKSTENSQRTSERKSGKSLRRADISADILGNLSTTFSNTSIATYSSSLAISKSNSFISEGSSESIITDENRQGIKARSSNGDTLDTLSKSKSKSELKYRKRRKSSSMILPAMSFEFSSDPYIDNNNVHLICPGRTKRARSKRGKTKLHKKKKSSNKMGKKCKSTPNIDNKARRKNKVNKVNKVVPL